MNIPELTKKLSEEFGVTIESQILLIPTPKQAVVHYGNVIINQEANTRLLHTTIDFTLAVPYFKVMLQHLDCVRWGGSRKINKAPYNCTACGKEAISAEDGIRLGLPINPNAKKKIQIFIVGEKWLGRYGDFEVHNLTAHAGMWFHKCRELQHYEKTRMTIDKFPKKCKYCDEPLGAADFDLNMAFKLPSFVGDKQ